MLHPAPSSLRRGEWSFRHRSEALQERSMVSKESPAPLELSANGDPARVTA